MPIFLRTPVRGAQVALLCGLLCVLTGPAPAAPARPKRPAPSAAAAPAPAPDPATLTEDEWVRAVVKAAQTRLVRYQHETAAKELIAAAGKRRLTAYVPRVLFALYYAQVLDEYAERYAWEISQRTQIAAEPAAGKPGDEIADAGGDVTRWTRAQLFGAVQRAYDGVWQDSATLGAGPAAPLREFIEPGNQPKGTRETLRDLIGQLYAGHFARVARAVQGGGTGDEPALDAMPGPGGPAAAGALGGDPEAQPQRKLSLVLGELAEWHQRAGRGEAALLARLVRITMLYDLQQGTGTAPDRLRAELRRLTEGVAPSPVWALAQAKLASLTQDDAADPMARVVARRLAQQVTEKAPGTLGAQQAAAAVRQLDAPAFQLEGVTVDGPGRRSVRVRHTNLRTLAFRAYKYDPLARLRAGKDGVTMDWDELSRLVRTGRPAAAWSVALPETQDLQEHQTFVVPPLTEPGTYAIVASRRADFVLSKGGTQALSLTVSELVVWATGEGSKGARIRAVSGKTGLPLPGVAVTLYESRWDRKPRVRALETRTTDASGAVVLRPPLVDGDYTAVAQLGGEAVVLEDLPGWEAEPPTQPVGALVYTDRSAYRPLQKIQWKVVAYRRSPDGSELKTEVRLPITVRLRDANDQVAAERTMSTTAFGTASGEFTVPAGRLLGAWRLESSYGGSAALRVEEYKRPTFDLAIKDPARTLRLGQPAQLTGEARYYFGMPVAGGRVRWRVQRSEAPPRWADLALDGRVGALLSRRLSPGTRARIVASGVSAVAADGTFPIRFVPEGGPEPGAPPPSFQITADLTDEGGETRTAQRSFRIGHAAIEPEIGPEIGPAAGLLRASAGGELTLWRRDLDGIGRAGRATWRLARVALPAQAPSPAELPLPRAVREALATLPSGAQTPGDGQRARGERYDPGQQLRDAPESADASPLRGELQHGPDGKASLRLPPLPPGVYRLHLETQDDSGARAEAVRELVVAPEPGTPAPAAYGLPLLVRAEQERVRVGETARILVAAAADQPVLLTIYRDGRRQSERMVRAGRDAALVELPITRADRGGLTVVADAVVDHHHLQQTVDVHVPWDDRELQVDFATFRDRLRPGARETLRVTVRGADGSPIGPGVAELLAYMYDLSLDLIEPHTPASTSSLYPARTGAPWTRDALGTSGGQLLETDDDDPTRFELPVLRPDALLLRPRPVFGLGLSGQGRGGGGTGYGTIGLGNLGTIGRGAGPGPGGGPPVEAAKKDARGGATPGEPRRRARGGPDRDADGILDKADAEPAPLRQNFAETAFFLPNLLTGPDGAVTIEFTVPDSVTAWRVWVHAVTRDLRGGATARKTRSAKDLVVRPYLPRFLREGDRAELAVLLSSAADRPLSGQVRLEVVDAETGAARGRELGLGADAAVRPFSVAAGGSARVGFMLAAPRELGQLALRVTATAPGLSDGELRPLPILPGRLHLLQSRTAVLRDGQARALRFADLAAGDDPTQKSEQLVVTVEAQLFYSALAALPSLLLTPHECVEQTQNRFVSAGIVAALAAREPALAPLMTELGRRQTPLVPFQGDDPNRKMALEETPFLDAARGGVGPGPGALLQILDPRVAAATRDRAIGELRKAQRPDGAFPWWPGGPASPFMTLYLVQGFARALEFGVPVPSDLLQSAWRYLAAQLRREILPRLGKRDCCVEHLVRLGYVSTLLPAGIDGALTPAERQQLLSLTLRHRGELSLQLRAYLALTLQRLARPAEARRVLDELLALAQTTPEQGTFFQPEARAWLWHRDTIESHALILYALTEVSPEDPRRDGLVQWLLLNKTLGQWKSTRATAEAVYALAHVLKKTGGIGARESVSVAVGKRTAQLDFAPEAYTGHAARLVVPGSELRPDTEVRLGKRGPGLAVATATWHFTTEQSPQKGHGDLFALTRRYFRRDPTQKDAALVPLVPGTALRPGDEVEVWLTVRSHQAAEYVHLRDPRPAGLEPDTQRSAYESDLGLSYYRQPRDSSTDFFFEELPAGEYTLKHRLRVATAGTFRVGPATLQSMYAPEFGAYSAGETVTIAPEQRP